jgi:hypothetical protein
MLQSITELENIISRYTPLLSRINRNGISERPAVGKWSPKEIIGHMIDSAQNNIRRFIVAQYEDEPYIVYRQDDWVRICDYQHWGIQDLISLWSLLNKQIVMIWKNMPEEKAQRTCRTQESHTIEWLAEDYNKHVLHHLHHVLEMEPVAYP